jgi:hypothetical protein
MLLHRTICHGSEVIKRAEVFESRAMTERILVLILKHSGPLGAQHIYCLVHVYHTLTFHSLKNNTKSYEYARPPHAHAAMNRNRTPLVRLIVHFLHLSDELYKASPRVWHSHVRPISELELMQYP